MPKFRVKMRQQLPRALLYGSVICLTVGTWAANNDLSATLLVLGGCLAFCSFVEVLAK